MPIIRTFAPFVAGVANMRYSSFASFDVFGAIGWVISMTVLGELLGRIPLVLRVIFVSLLPVAFHAVKGMLERKPAGPKPALQPGD